MSSSRPATPPESGVGKELVARSVHFNSPRHEYPFIALNCAAMPQSLIESELFGHEKGSFTGARGRKLGKFELANKGTLFLDEIGELPPEMQVKLLRVLEQREEKRIGGTRPIKVYVRIVAATNRNLEEEVRAGRFREDLFYRLAVVPVPVPPLRERREDVPELAARFLAEACERNGRRPMSLSREGLAALALV